MECPVFRPFQKLKSDRINAGNLDHCKKTHFHNCKRSVFSLAFSLYTVGMRSRHTDSDADRQPYTLPALMPNWARGLALLAAVLFVSFAVGVSQAPVGQSGDPQPRDIMTWPPINPLANRTADANRILEDEMKRRDNQKRFAKLNEQRRKDMTSDTEKLLALANQLKAETDAISKDALSMDSVRQAEQIEKLAHNVREKMRASVSN